MKTRNILAVTALDRFKNWLVSDGWEIQPTKGEYEVLRAIKEGRKPLIIYNRLSTNNGGPLVHLTVLDRDVGVVRAFLKDKREGKNG